VAFKIEIFVKVLFMAIAKYAQISQLSISFLSKGGIDPAHLVLEKKGHPMLQWLIAAGGFLAGNSVTSL